VDTPPSALKKPGKFLEGKIFRGTPPCPVKKRIAPRDIDVRRDGGEMDKLECNVDLMQENDPAPNRDIKSP
jgi:hypothetical protein